MKIKIVYHVIVEMTPSTNANCGKVPVDEISDTVSNVGEPAQGELLLAMQNMVKEIILHRTEMAAQRNADSGRQSECVFFRYTKSISSRQTKHTSSRQTEPTFFRKTEATPSSNETFSRKKG